jgi:asparagine synthetase B (glutamine-hydrolysing)
MCGVFAAFSSDKKFLNKVASLQDSIIQTIQKRGPDKSTVEIGENFVVIHTLLSMTGFRTQPIKTDKSMLIFNGEVYNDFMNYTNDFNDADYIALKFEKKGAAAFEKFDGEFAIVLYSKKDNQLFLATDPFATKPLYFKLGKDFCLAGSYQTTVEAAGGEGGIEQIPSNRLIQIDLNNFKIVKTSHLVNFNFKKQTNKSFATWSKAFQKALVKRTLNTKHRAFVGLSSGHDSGLIAAELINLKIPFHAYIMTYLEDQEIIKERIRILKENKITFDIVVPSSEDWLRMKKFVKENIDPYQLVNKESKFQNYADPRIHMIPGTISGCLINEKARLENRLISLSGQGGDEIYADYYNEFTYSRMSELKGNWENINSPWKNFSGGWNQVFLGANERVSGLFGIESRYPFLDFEVVQEFLDLDPKLKAKYYKSPITNRLLELKFPFHYKKFGFAGFKDDTLSTKPAPQL